MEIDRKIKWCVEQHQKTNHFYDKYLPYEFHLRMVAKVANDFIKVIERSVEGDVGDWVDTIIVASYGHDLIEDTRVSYNDVKEILGVQAAEIIYAVTNEKGKNRKERANDKYYEGIVKTPGAVFVKLCDRIANVQYSKMTGSRMFEMYKKENEHFVAKLGLYDDYNNHPCLPLFIYLGQLFKEN